MTELTIDQALQQGVEAHKAGQVQEADRLYTSIIQAQPKHPDANHNMGVLAVGVGKVQEALPFFKTALEANPATAQFWLSYIDTLIKLDQLADAKAVLDQAKSNGAKGDGFDKLERRLKGLARGPVGKASKVQDPPQNQQQSVINFYNQGKLQQAIEQAIILLQQFPSSSSLYNISGAVYKGLGQLDASVSAYKKAISIKPDYAEAYYNMGVTLQEQGKLEEAIEACKKALVIKPDYADAYYNMGLVLQDQGKLDEAIESYTKALSIRPDYSEAYYNIGITLIGIVFHTPDSGLQKIITSILDHKTYVRPSQISEGAISLLKVEPVIKKLFEEHSQGYLNQSFQETVLTLCKLPLLLKLMSICPLADLELETVLSDIRFNFLSSVSEMNESSGLLRFQSALALQCFTNEYIYNQNDNETKALQALEAGVAKVLSNGQQPSPQSILCLASYKPLNQYEWSSSLLVTNEIEDVFTRQITEPNQEAYFKTLLPVLGDITDKVSAKVREQYEASPYPRWVNLGLQLEPAPISKVVDEIKLELFDDKIKVVQSPNILIAGCGTGQQSIGTAARFKNSKILAIDLSLHSLAYAKRKTEELGIGNIEYMQADILELGKLNRQFDMVESTGVLHHMDDPVAGWRILTDCLRSGGLMKIGLYSELARQHIVEVRQEISNAGIGSSNEEMKSFRTMVMNSDQNHHKRILNSRDFYSLSELKDLLFHVQEHRFTIPQIQDCLSELGLKFCGFEANKIVTHFKITNTNADDPYDLDKWQTYEEANPNTFLGMYQFWCQKIA